MVTIDGLPLHPLVIHAVVVLLPLAALGAVLVAVRPSWRRTYGIPVLLIAAVGVAAVPIATTSGEQLEGALPGPNPLIEIHEHRADMLLPYAIAFLVLLAVAVLAERVGARAGDGGGVAVATRTRIATVAAVLAALLGIVVAGLVVWIGDAGATSVWHAVTG